MNDRDFDFNEEKYPGSIWLKDKDCLISSADKKRIVLLDEEESSALWDGFIPFENPERAPWLRPDGQPFVLDVEKEVVSKFDDASWKQIGRFLDRVIGDHPIIFYFWCRTFAGIVPKDILLYACEDFFYFDDFCFLLVPNTDIVVYNCDNAFYHCKLNLEK
jgi:hypothetical protein